MKTSDPETRRAQAAALLRKFLKDNPEWVGDGFVCTHDEWARRGEPYGKSSLATLVVDGSPLYGALHEHSGDRVIAKLDKALEAEGMYHELGFAWTLHIYEI